MATYAKINLQTGNVKQFPYRLNDPLERRNANAEGAQGGGRELPEDAVEVDTQTLKPSVAWDEVLRYDAVIQDPDGVYRLRYNVEPRNFGSENARLNKFKQLYNAKKQQNDKKFKSDAEKLVEDYPSQERESWHVQSREAEAYANDPQANVPLITSLAQSRGETVEETVQRIRTKDSEFRTAYGEILGKFQKNDKILEQIDFDDDTTWSLIDTITGV